ncbi:hypothetical protein BMS3Abin07_00001 [bacterium BMS3Abin07]|nr:hypothetical protein BMS3Abin07_00001 [bacterium BMS3Abin07]GBE31840.1 hypothetical protein BMS3Bbin05_00743 [bacterium BMS3Bbin05]HDO23158.1 DUF433 domain-containing protein [Nitrospirota bacterium]
MGLAVKKIKKHPYISIKKGVCGGEPVITGTRISVSLIIEMDRAGHSVDEIVAMYPHITHAQVYDALSYYYDHKEEIDRIIEENKEGYWIEKTEGETWRK